MVKCSYCAGVCSPMSFRCYTCGRSHVGSYFGNPATDIITPEQLMHGIDQFYVDNPDQTFTASPKPNTLTGLSSSYYELPEGCKELQDLIEYKQMNFARGNIFKAAYRLGDKPGTEAIYDLEKIIWFAQREVERIKNES